MEAVTGLFVSQREAERGVADLYSAGIPADWITFLTPGNAPGVGQDRPAGNPLLAAFVPGVGTVTAAGLLGAAVLAAAGANVESGPAQSVENPISNEVREDQIFIYEDALRRGRTVLIALAGDAVSATSLRDRLQACGAQEIDAARHQWWSAVRGAEQKHYSESGKNFADDEKFYRLGFESAQHARYRCKEFDQASAEMSSKLEDLQKEYPGVDLEEAFTRGYRRGREYYQRVCDAPAA